MCGYRKTSHEQEAMWCINRCGKNKRVLLRLLLRVGHERARRFCIQREKWRKHYDEGLKTAKPKEGSAKYELIKQVNQNKFQGEFFERLQTMQHTIKTAVEQELITWNQITDLDGIPLTLAHIEQGSIKQIWNTGLDPKHPSTERLAEECRYFYKRVKTTEVSESEEINSGTRKNKCDPRGG